MKFSFRYLMAFLLTLPMVNGKEFDERHFPIQEGGRIKPLDTFARNQLLSINSKRSLKENTLPAEMQKTKLTAIDWLIDISLHPEDADKYRVEKNKFEKYFKENIE